MTALLLYVAAPVRDGDDGWFITTWMTGFQGNLLEFLGFRYKTWSTRILLEAYTLLLLYFPMLYRISMPLWLVFIAGGIIRLLNVKEQQAKWLICAGILLLPVSFNGNAGFVCSTVNYVFTLACLMWVLVTIVESQQGKQIPVWRYVLTVLLMIFGCNMEYYCPPMLLVCIFFSVRGMVLRKGRVLSGGMTVICVLSLIYAFTAPASTVSAYNETNQFFPGYELLSTWEKLQAGFVATAGGLVSTTTHGDHFLVGTLTAGALLLLYGLEREERLPVKLVYGLPLAISLAAGVPVRFLPEENLWRTLFFHVDAGWKWDSPITLAVALVFFGALLFALFRLDKRLGWAGAVTLFCRITMGASSSVFASGLRTFYPLLFVLCLTCGMALNGIQKRRKVGEGVFLAGILVTYLMNIFYLYT